ncbi:3'-5' exonuclease [Sphingomonas jeddahensis]|uniref:DNA polymerase III PolC-type n=1 Tax=Sphingomonas jeddahensis TaxID=1915074 RepID=A0A1V2EWH4_9SPHN|nr:3'-5' exonuclease [Sphingomonas jeddahensis]ONF97026.1 DNA polymerase III PolC-type [Sphingomonas jeddahensis]
MHEIRHLAASALMSDATADPDIRILRRVNTPDTFPLAADPVGTTRRIAIVDTECTGTDPQLDEIIDIAVVVVEADECGQIVGIDRVGQALRDPGMPIPAVISRLTGITDDHVRGRTIDLDRLERLLAGADVRIAHSAVFDIAFIENLMPGLAGASWACSMNDFDWLSAGFDGRKLGHLLMQIGRFNDAHRAMSDVISLLHLLAHRLDDGRTVLGQLLENAAMPSLRIEATNAPFDRRGLLKARGYRWDPRGRVWWCEISADEYESEALWLQREVTPHGPAPRTRPVTWHERHR